MAENLANLERDKPGGTSQLEIEQRAAAAAAGFNNKLIQNRQQQVATQSDISKILAEKHMNIREFQEEAWRDVVTQRENQKQDRIGVGMSDPGTINLLKRIQGRAGAGKELLPYEMQAAKQYGLAASEQVDAQAQKKTENSGLKFRSDKNVKIAEDEAAFRAKYDPEAEQLQKEGNRQSVDVSKAADQYVKAVKDAVHMDEAVAIMIQKLDEVIAESKQEILKLKAWMPHR